MKPKDAHLAAGSDVTIACRARDASLSWRRVGMAVLPEHVTSDGGKLRLDGVKPSDAGLYVCTATSSDHSQSIDTVIRIDVTGQSPAPDDFTPYIVRLSVKAVARIFARGLTSLALPSILSSRSLPPSPFLSIPSHSSISFPFLSLKSSCEVWGVAVSSPAGPKAQTHSDAYSCQNASRATSFQYFGGGAGGG